MSRSLHEGRQVSCDVCGQAVGAHFELDVDGSGHGNWVLDMHHGNNAKSYLGVCNGSERTGWSDIWEYKLADGLRLMS